MICAGVFTLESIVLKQDKATRRKTATVSHSHSHSYRHSHSQPQSQPQPQSAIATVTATAILLKTLAYVKDIDGLTKYFEFQCFTSQLLIGDENQFWGQK